MPAPTTPDALQLARSLSKAFVIGCAKSGTTWVQNLLAGHPQVAASGEGAFAWRLAPLLSAAIRQFNEHQRSTGQPDTARIDDDERLALLRHAIELRWATYVRASAPWRDGRGADLRFVCDKTPQHTVGIRDLELLCPGAHYVHIVRDPRDAAVSAWFHFGKAEGKTFEHFIAHYVGVVWPANVGGARREAPTLGDRWLELRYEDLLADELAQTRRLLEHLGLDASERALEQCLSSGSFRNRSGGRERGQTSDGAFYRSGVAGDWRERLTPELAQRACQPVAGLMRSCGYEPDAAPTAA